MGSRPQKSFFDTAATNKRPQWKPFKPLRPNNEQPYPLPPNKPPVPKAPFRISTPTKTKLQAFQFNQDNPSIMSTKAQDAADGGKENAVASQKERDHRPTEATPRSQRPLPKMDMRVVNQCPQTPVGRLPLAELVASGEDTHQALNLTPVERVLWGNSTYVSEQGSSQEIPPLPRARKRAHSSSPASSSQRKKKVSKHFSTEKTPAEIQVSHKALKTPQGDPASELLSRYSLNTHSTERQSPTKIIGRPFSQLMNSSSPQTPAQAFAGRECAGLRRSFSCGTEWPTSAAKRRKLQHTAIHHDPSMGLAASGEPIMKSQKSKSRLSLLVDKIHEDLTRPSTEETDDSPATVGGSSQTVDDEQVAIPRCSAKESAQSERPHNTQEILQDDGRNWKEMPSSAKKVQDAHQQQSDKQTTTKSDADSDFGDDELDLEIFEAAEAPVATAKSVMGIPQEVETTVVKPESNLLYGNRAHQSNEQEKPTLQSPERPISSNEESDDEFDDGTNDVSTEDFENAVALYASQLDASSNIQPKHQQKHSSVISLADKVAYESKILPTKASNKDNPELVESSSDDEFGGDLDFEQIAAECTEEMTDQATVDQRQRTSDSSHSVIQRYVIMTVTEGVYQTSKGQSRPEKVLLVKDESTKLSKAITLRQSWVDSPCFQGSYLHLIGHFDRYGQCVVDDTQGLLILHPDHLISATVVADSFSCTRRAVLQDRVKATGDASEPQIYGSILHEIFQEAMRANRWDDVWLTSTIEDIATRYLEKLFEINIEVPRAVDHLKSRVVEMQAWADVFVAAKPKTNAMVRDRNGTQVQMSVNKLLDVEEKIWSPKYGLKGMVDATVQITMQDGKDARTLTVPFEVKTGKNSTAAHKAQTALYTLLCSDRYDLDVACGILYYMETSETSRVPAIRHELIHMIKQRNELAGFVRQKHEIPPMLKNSAHLCGKCYAQKTCFIYHKLVDDGNGETTGLKEMFDELAKHLNPTHQQFFTKWDNLLSKEEKDIVKLRRELWTLQSSEREKLGRCFSNVVIEAGSYVEIADAPKINRYRYTFIKQKLQPGFSFKESHMTLGEPIVISDEKGHFALASGYVTAVRKHKVQVTIDRRLHNARSKSKHFDSINNQSFAGIMEIVESGSGSTTINPSQPDGEILYRIDKDEFSNGMATVRNNLVNIMDKDAFMAQPLRKLIVENVEPTFRSISTAGVSVESASQANLNVDQKCAIAKVMSAKDYALVLGMPGTGKTTTIAHIIRALTAQRKSVLLTSYTHTAVDNILLKIRKDNIGIFRLGAVAKVHPEVQEFADLGGRPMKTVQDLKRAYGQQVVATTCLGINHPIFSQRTFDYCIVDEASQITLPVCLGPIRMARTFILVGDHFQLPPLVQNKEAQEGGLDISLFKMLSDNQPSSVTNLEHQYRMCEDIMTLSNTLIYNGRLKCGTPAVAQRSITIPNIDALRQHHHSSSSILSTPNPQRICINPQRGNCWLRDLLDPSVKACFVNTDPLWPASREAETGSRITNPFEATLCQQLVESLITTGISQTEIGVITLYRSQLALIKHNLRHRPGVEMHTADKFQGRDKEVVVLSLVRNNENSNVGELLKDWRRVNVALTRARTKLLVLGSKKTLEGNDLLKDFVKLMESRGWRYDLPPGALEGHLFDDGATQTSGARSSGLGPEGKVAVGDVEQKGGFADRKENAAAKGRKVPAKKGTMDIRALLGKKPVLRDIVNDAS